jgi:hypothetical protein
VVWKARILDNLENNALMAFSQGFRASALARHWLTLEKMVGTAGFESATTTPLQGLAEFFVTQRT